MKLRPASLLAVFALTWIFTPLASLANEWAERVDAAYLLAFGRTPSVEEKDRWLKQVPSLTVPELFSRLRAQLQDDAAAQRSTAVQAFRDAFGRAPIDVDLRTAGTGPAAGLTYTEHVQRHLQTLAADPASYQQVLNRAYQLLLRRDVYPEEIEYWKKHDTLSFALLVGCIEDWARRNQPGLMVTNGTPTVSINSEFLTTVRLSPGVAAEARAAAGLAPAGEGGHHLVAAGGARVATGGRIHFAAAGVRL
jgi:hypothetical protein